MKAPSAILLAVVVAAAAAFITYEVIKQQKGPPWVFETPSCERVKLKVTTTDEAAVKAFEDLLKRVDANSQHGSRVNLRYQLSNSTTRWKEEEGPSIANNDFPEVTPICTPNPAGSMHNTQKVNASTWDDYKAVLNSFDFAATSSPPSPPTPTPKP